ncbi:hypothetical protein [Saccharicrinis sp. FJH54]|uniref:hypothetical protein n=1 Tax=Saccharicrinis sp. FJH54 TaxID=3344665 RepID=UPI0035D3E252
MTQIKTEYILIALVVLVLAAVIQLSRIAKFSKEILAADKLAIENDSSVPVESVKQKSEPEPEKKE